MKKRLYLITTIILSGSLLFLSSCLKDSSYVDFSKAGSIVEFPLGGTPFFTSAAVTDPGDTITKQFAVNISSVNVPTTATTVDVAVDNTIIAPYNAANSGVTYLQMPVGSYVFTTKSVTVAGGTRSAVLSVTFYKNLLDPSKSYMLPIRITNAGGLNISGNQNVYYWHFIGNDFAGVYNHYYTRWSDGDTTTAPSTPRTLIEQDIFNPISPNEFTVITLYYTQPHYDVTFNKTIVNGVAMYSGWAIQFLAADVASGTQWAANITVTTPPEFLPTKFVFSPTASYTYAQSLELFRFYFHTATRAIIDEYDKP